MHIKKYKCDWSVLSNLTIQTKARRPKNSTRYILLSKSAFMNAQPQPVLLFVCSFYLRLGLIVKTGKSEQCHLSQLWLFEVIRKQANIILKPHPCTNYQSVQRRCKWVCGRVVEEFPSAIKLKMTEHLDTTNSTVRHCFLFSEYEEMYWLYSNNIPNMIRSNCNQCSLWFGFLSHDIKIRFFYFAVQYAQISWLP